MDTVIIKIYGPNKFRISDPSQFVPEIIKRSYDELSETEKSSPLSRPYLRRFILRPKNLFEFKGDYLPRVEVFETFNEDRDDIRYVLKAEFSVPKLLYGNSLLEVTEGDKEEVFRKLKIALAKVNIIIELDTISKASVTALHLCKNVLLPRAIKMREILDELMRVDINKVVDVSGKQFKNGARVLNIYAGVTERSFYDKISDSIRPKNKRSDKGHIHEERSFIENHNLQGKEVFRYEYRLKRIQTVKREVNAALGREAKTIVAFKDLFSNELFKMVTIKSWRELIERPENQLALFRTVSKLDLFLHILGEAEKRGTHAHSMNTALISYGLACAIQDHGAKETRRAIFAIWNTDHPERVNKRIAAAAELTSGLPYSNAIAFVDAAVEKFELINLASIQNGI